MPRKGTVKKTAPTRPSDQQVVAAFNSCIDLEKFRGLPLSVRDRIKNLLCHHRMKPVCFFDALGFGLRVYEEPKNITFDGDECEHNPDGGGHNFFQVDVNGRWMRCPASLWTDNQVNKWIVADEYAKRYVGVDYNLFDDDEESDFDWCLVRNTNINKVFTDYDEAERVRKACKGIIIKLEE